MTGFEMMATDLVDGMKGEPRDTKIKAVEGALRHAYELGQVSVLRQVKERITANENLVVPV